MDLAYINAPREDVKETVEENHIIMYIVRPPEKKLILRYVLKIRVGWVAKRELKRERKPTQKKDNDRETFCEYVRVNKIRLTLTHVCLRRWDDFYHPILRWIRYNSVTHKGLIFKKTLFCEWHCTLCICKMLSTAISNT